MPTLHMTDRMLRSLATRKDLEDFYDSVLPGFGARVHRSGSRTFFVRYRAAGKNRRTTLGTYPAISLAEAREKARAIQSDVARKLDPAEAADARRDASSFGDLAALYLERHARRHKRSWPEDERILNKELLPRWRDLKAVEVRRKDVLSILDAIVDRGAPILANRVLALIRKIFNWGIGRDLVEHNPCLAVSRPSPERRRDRVLSELEIAALWQAWEQENVAVRAAFQLLLLTAQRRSEVVQMRRADVHGDVWILAPEATKAKRGHTVPLSRSAQQILRSLVLLDEDPWMIPSPRVAKAPLHADSLAHAARRVGRATGIEWRIHDLRRTAASHMSALGVSRVVVSHILNHADWSVTAIYDRHSYLPEMREALELWGSHVESVVGLKPRPK